MTTTDYRHQLSITGAGWMYNFRADSDADFEAGLDTVGALAPAVAETAGLLLAAGNVAVGGLTAQVPGQRQAPAVESSGGPGPSCQHGARVFKSGTSKSTGKPWSAWMCPLPNGAQGKCDVQWA